MCACVYFLIWRSILLAYNHYSNGESISARTMREWARRKSSLCIEHHCFSIECKHRNSKLKHSFDTRNSIENQNFDHHQIDTFRFKSQSMLSLLLFSGGHPKKKMNQLEIHTYYKISSSGKKIAAFPYSLDSCFQLILRRSHNIQVSLSLKQRFIKQVVPIQWTPHVALSLCVWKTHKHTRSESKRYEIEANVIYGERVSKSAPNKLTPTHTHTLKHGSMKEGKETTE